MITATQDVIDSREIIERIEELNNLRDDPNTENDFGDEENDELDMLETFAEKMESEATGWTYGVLFIRWDHFKVYAQEYAEEVIDKWVTEWPFCHVDWDEAADALKQDYSEAEFGGIIYFYR